MSVSVRLIALVVPDLRAAEAYYQPLFDMQVIGREVQLDDWLWYTIPTEIYEFVFWQEKSVGGDWKMRSGVIYFKIVAIIFILSGILGLVVADQYISLLGADASVGGRLWGRAFGAVSMGFGIMFWMMNPSDDLRARKIGAVGAVLAFGLTGLIDVVSVLAGDLPSYGWGFVAFHAVMLGLALSLLVTRE